MAPALNGFILPNLLYLLKLIQIRKETLFHIYKDIYQTTSLETLNINLYNEINDIGN